MNISEWMNDDEWMNDFFVSFQRDDLATIAFLLGNKRLIVDDLEGSKVVLPYLLHSITSQLTKVVWELLFFLSLSLSLLLCATNTHFFRPFFVQSKCWLNLEELNVNFDQVRRCSISLLSSIVATTSYFESLQFAIKLPKESNQKQIDLLPLTITPSIQFATIDKPLQEITNYASVRNVCFRMFRYIGFFVNVFLLLCSYSWNVI
jgi:hypothetical protein